MSKKSLQSAFLSELAAGFHATANRIVDQLDADPPPSEARRAEIVKDQLQGLFHGILVTFDGGSGLADQGLVSIVNEAGEQFDRNLHEQYLDFWEQASD